MRTAAAEPEQLSIRSLVDLSIMQDHPQTLFAGLYIGGALDKGRAMDLSKIWKEAGVVLLKKEHLVLTCSQIRATHFHGYRFALQKSEHWASLPKPLVPCQFGHAVANPTQAGENTPGHVQEDPPRGHVMSLLCNKRTQQMALANIKSKDDGHHVHWTDLPLLADRSAHKGETNGSCTGSCKAPDAGSERRSGIASRSLHRQQTR
jgi:hypothetical protein